MRVWIESSKPSAPDLLTSVFSLIWRAWSYIWDTVAVILISDFLFTWDWFFLLELMLLGLISLLLAQCARWISEICVNSTFFGSRFYICSEDDLEMNEKIMLESPFPFPDKTDIPKGLNSGAFHQCGEVTYFINYLASAFFIYMVSWENDLQRNKKWHG